MVKIAICDDEKNVCGVLEDQIRHFFGERREECDTEVWCDSESICKQIGEYNPDILFLDIELPGYNGVHVGKYIRDVLLNDNMNIIFISHKTSYAMELFQIHPYDFLIKPIDEETLNNVLTKLLKYEEVKNKAFRYMYNKTEYVVQFNDILYFSSRNKSVFIHKKNGDVVFYYGKLRDFIHDLPFQFTSISKSYIVNIRYIKSWNSSSVILEDDTRLTVAQSRRGEFKNAIINYGMGG